MFQNGCTSEWADNFDSLATSDSKEIPEQFFGVTGINMTVLIPETFISALPLTSDTPYIVALTNSGLVVGSASLSEQDLNVYGQTSIAVWGDDTYTPEIDGAIDQEEILFQLVDGDKLYDLDVTDVVNDGGQHTYTSNSVMFLTEVSYEIANTVSCFRRLYKP